VVSLNRKKKNDIPKIVVSQAKASGDKPAARETSEAQVDAANEPSSVQPEAIQPFDQPPPAAETVQDTPEPATLWDSLVVKKGKGGDHEKPKKKHHGTAGEENRDSKQGES